MRRFIALLLAAVTCIGLCACANGGESEYLAEEVVGEVEKGSDEWEILEEMLRMLTVDSIDIPEFDTMRESINLFRDSVLNYLSCENYRRYAGNGELLAAIRDEYPGLDPISAISKNEFESEMYRVFGGKVKITHESTKLFTYLDRSYVYVPITVPIEGGIDFELLTAEETENTYRIEFTCSEDEAVADYFAMLIKREDGSCYFSMLVRR